MKKKMRRFADGGETTDMLPKSALDRLAEGEESGMFDKDVYARARKFMREQAARGDEEPSAPRAAPRAMPAAPAARPTPMAAGRAEIPVDTSLKAPAREGRMMGETERNVRNILGATTPGIGKGLSALGTPLLAEGVKGAQVGRAAARGAADRKRIQAARAAGKKKEAEAMEEAKPVLQASKKRMSPRGRTRDEMEDYELRAKGGKISGYAKGGSVRGSGCEQRGLRKCKVV